MASQNDLPEDVTEKIRCQEQAAFKKLFDNDKQQLRPIFDIAADMGLGMTTLAEDSKDDAA